MEKSKTKHAHFGLWESPEKCITHQTFTYGSRQELVGIARGLQWMLEHQYQNPHVEFYTSDEPDGPEYYMNNSRTYSLKDCRSYNASKH